MNNMKASVLSLVSVVLLSLSSLAGCAVDANGEETARDESAIGTQESALKKLDPCSGSIFNCEEPSGGGSGGGGPGDPHTTPPTWLIQQCATEHNECRTDCKLDHKSPGTARDACYAKCKKDKDSCLDY